MKYRIVWPALERWLTENKISVNRFGQMLGVSTNTIYHYVRGFREPTLSMCQKMADVTGMTMDDLFGQK